MTDFLCCVLPFVAILGGLGVLVLFWRRASMHGFEASLAMDGATCLRAQDGSLVFRRQTVRSWIYTIILVFAELGVLAMLPGALRGLSDAETSFWEAIDNVLLLIGIAGFLGAVIYVLLRSLRLPQASLDAGDRVLRTGRGKARREIPFADISRITVRSVHRGSFEDTPTGAFEIGVLVRDKERLPLGSVSGETEQAAERATTIAQWIGDLTGAQTEQPVW